MRHKPTRAVGKTVIGDDLLAFACFAQTINEFFVTVTGTHGKTLIHLFLLKEEIEK